MVSHRVEGQTRCTDGLSRILSSADLRARMLARGESALVSELDAHVRRVLPETVDPEVVESARTEPLEPF